jgi:hypothetical protein
MTAQAEDTQKAAVRPEDPAEIALKRPDAIMHFEQDGRGFEERGVSNGARHWYARESWSCSATRAWPPSTRRSTGPSAPARRCIPVMENFQQCRRTVAGRTEPDCKLTRFACYPAK